MQGITVAIAERAAEQPGAVALVGGTRVWTRGELWERVQRTAGLLGAAGFGPGQRVGLLGGHGRDYVVHALALLDLGAVIVPLQAGASADRCAQVAQQLDVVGWVGKVGSVPALEQGILRSEEDLAWWRPERDPLPPSQDLDGLAFIRFTSGTTDAARGVALTHESIRARHRAANEVLGLGAEDGVLFPLDMAHHFVVSVLLVLSVGARLLLPEQALPGKMVETAQAGRATVVFGAPHHLRMLAGGAPVGSLSGLRLALSTTAPLASAVPGDFLARHGVPLGQAYGIIEVGLPCIDLDGCPGTVGVPLPAFEVKLLDPLEGVGRVVVRGPGMFDAYVSPWQPRDGVLDGGWFLTGDLGRFDEAGRLVLLGREQAVINFGGVKIFPVELEDVLNRHPQVAESLVYGQDHPRLGQLPRARVVALPGSQPTERDLLQWLRRHVPPRELPLGVEVVKSLPRTATGKLLRRLP